MISPRLFKYNALKQLKFAPVTKCFYSTTGSSQEEISHFKDLSTDWWNTNGSQRILHKMNLARLDFMRTNLNKLMTIEDQQDKDIFIPGYNYKEFLPSGISSIIEKDLDKEIQRMLNEKQFNVLDIGCGGGILAESLARLPFINHVTGIDLTPECIDVAQKHAAKDPTLDNKINYKLCDLATVEDKFDIVTCYEMLEHVDNPHEILRQAWKRLNPQGILFLSTINRDFVSWFTTIFVAEYITKLVPQGTHTYDKFVKSSEIVDWFQQRQPRKHKILDLKGTMYVPSKGWVNHDCPSVGNYFMAVQKLKE
ncbi:ubiquinone biosynthesis O-methyltransferase, mitochondrial [Monosporozyma unispora]